MIDPSPSRQAIAARLKRIEGQAKGLNRMLDSNRYCIDILQQIQAIMRSH
ncbi:MAG: metal-sensitive transcriptional regulator [Gammaproteobacteria bacterium]|nr:metal-sensitive transcriptional regulator [Gammaproteobacteria bacterium]